MPEKLLSVVTGASSGIGRELAGIAAGEGHDLILCSEGPDIHTVAERLTRPGIEIEAVEADLATATGVETLASRIGARPVDCLMANAGVGLGGAFLDQEWHDIKRVIDTNVTGTTALLHRIGGDMRRRDSGRILVTGSLVGTIPGTWQAVYNATKSYIENLAYALRNELKETSVSVTCLMPGATDTEFFDRAGMGDTPVGQTDEKDDPAKVARAGFDAMMKGESGVTPGAMNKLASALSDVVPQSVLSRLHERMARPGGADGDEGRNGR